MEWNGMGQSAHVFPTSYIISFSFSFPATAIHQAPPPNNPFDNIFSSTYILVMATKSTASPSPHTRPPTIHLGDSPARTVYCYSLPTSLQSQSNSNSNPNSTCLHTLCLNYTTYTKRKTFPPSGRFSLPQVHVASPFPFLSCFNLPTYLPTFSTCLFVYVKHPSSYRNAKHDESNPIAPQVPGIE